MTTRAPKTDTTVDPSAHDTRKRHGDKLAVAAGATSDRPAGDAAGAGDSPKRQGDTMAGLLRPNPKR